MSYRPNRILWLIVIAAAAVVAFLPGCDEPKPAVVAPEPPSQPEQLSRVSAAVQQIRTDNAQNPDGPAKDAVDLQAQIASAGLPKPKPVHAAESAEVSALVFAGKYEAAVKRAATAEIELARLTDQTAKERSAGEQRLREIIADAERRIAAAQADAEKEAYLRVVSVFAVLGGAVSLAGLVCLITGWSRIGALLIPLGIILGGSGLLWGKPWFTYSIGGAVLLGGIALGIRWAVSVYEQRRGAAPIPSAAGATPGG
jgi:hypothetical protein